MIASPSVFRKPTKRDGVPICRLCLNSWSCQCVPSDAQQGSAKNYRAMFGKSSAEDQWERDSLEDFDRKIKNRILRKNLIERLTKETESTRNRRVTATESAKKSRHIKKISPISRRDSSFVPSRLSSKRSATIFNKPRSSIFDTSSKDGSSDKSWFSSFAHKKSKRASAILLADGNDHTQHHSPRDSQYMSSCLASESNGAMRAGETSFSPTPKSSVSFAPDVLSKDDYVQSIVYRLQCMSAQLDDRCSYVPPSLPFSSSYSRYGTTSEPNDSNQFTASRKTEKYPSLPNFSKNVAWDTHSKLVDVDTESCLIKNQSYLSSVEKETSEPWSVDSNICDEYTATVSLVPEQSETTSYIRTDRSAESSCDSSITISRQLLKYRPRYRFSSESSEDSGESSHIQTSSKFDDYCIFSDKGSDYSSQSSSDRSFMTKGTITSSSLCMKDAEYLEPSTIPATSGTNSSFTNRLLTDEGKIIIKSIGDSNSRSPKISFHTSTEPSVFISNKHSPKPPYVISDSNVKVFRLEADDDVGVAEKPLAVLNVNNLRSSGDFEECEDLQCNSDIDELHGASVPHASSLSQWSEKVLETIIDSKSVNEVECVFSPSSNTKSDPPVTSAVESRFVTDFSSQIDMLSTVMSSINLSTDESDHHLSSSKELLADGYYATKSIEEKIKLAEPVPFQPNFSSSSLSEKSRDEVIFENVKIQSPSVVQNSLKRSSSVSSFESRVHSEEVYRSNSTLPRRKISKLPCLSPAVSTSTSLNGMDIIVGSARDRKVFSCDTAPRIAPFKSSTPYTKYPLRKFYSIGHVSPVAQTHLRLKRRPSKDLASSSSLKESDQLEDPPYLMSNTPVINDSFMAGDVSIGQSHLNFSTGVISDQLKSVREITAFKSSADTTPDVNVRNESPPDVPEKFGDSWTEISQECLADQMFPDEFLSNFQCGREMLPPESVLLSAAATATVGDQPARARPAVASVAARVRTCDAGSGGGSGGYSGFSAQPAAEPNLDLRQQEQLLTVDRSIDRLMRERARLEAEIRQVRAESQQLVKASELMDTVTGQLCGQLDWQRSQHSLATAAMIRERDESCDELHKMKTLFAHRNRKYEESRAQLGEMAQQCGLTTVKLQEAVATMNSQLQKRHLVQDDSEDQLKSLLVEHEDLLQNKERELLQARAKLRLKERKLSKLEQENGDLTKLCDELIAKMGDSG